MVNRDDVSEFLATRRARLTPHDVGLPSGASRRVPGLRREEVAVLAGVSIDYYTRLERGNLTGVSDAVLEAVARALQLDEAERAHLLDLARNANNASTPRRRRPSRPIVRPGMQRLLDAMTDAPTVVRNGRLDVIATNALGRALLSPAFADATTTTNLARFTFIDPNGRDFFVDWTTSPTPPSRSCAPKPDATPTTATSPTSSASSPPAATSSVFAGPPTMSASTTTAPNVSTIPSSATSPSPSKNCPCPPTLA
jgi:transcriptional regulator with XRE-family HTH domain